MFFNISSSGNSFFKLILGFICFFITSSGIAQSDSLKQINQRAIKDSIAADVKKHSPKKAAIFSTVIPGMGQVYNKKYYKVPIIYAGFVGLGYMLGTAQKKYVTYRDAYKFRIDTLASTVDDYVGIYTNTQLDQLQTHYHKQRDTYIIGIAALYILNIVDAAVDAHLYYFDVSDKLSLQVQPFLNNVFQAREPMKGVTLTLKF